MSTVIHTYDPAYSTRRAADYLGISYRQMLDLIADGIVSALRTATGRYRVRLSALNAYIDTLDAV